MKSVSYSSCSELSCSSCGNAEVIICVDSSLTAAGYPYILGNYISTDIQTQCNGSTLNIYGFIYEEAQLLDPETDLQSGQIKGILCKGCLTDYIDSKIVASAGDSVPPQVLYNNLGNVGGFGFWTGTAFGYTGSGNYLATLGPELVANGDFASSLISWTYGGGVDWTWNAGKALHTAGNVTPLSQNITVSIGQRYLVAFTTSGTLSTTNKVVATINGTLITGYNSVEAGSAGTSYGIYTAPLSGAVTLEFTPAVGFAASIDSVSVKVFLSVSDSIQTVSDSVGNILYEIRGTRAFNNLAIGRDSFFSNVTGTDNVAFGPRALAYNINGFENTAVGSHALENNGTGYANDAFGYSALASNISGFQNSAFGHNALVSLTSGAYNIAVGNSSMFSATSCYSNVGIGTNTLYKTTTGNYNVAVGAAALTNNVTGSGNIAIGTYALDANLADYNNAVGLQSLYRNTTGTLNCAFGDSALENNLTGSSNMAFGHSASYALLSGVDTIAVGQQALYFSTASTNIGIGTLAGVVGGNNYNLTGTQNIWIGYRAGPDVDRLTPVDNSIAIGHQAHNTKSNEVQLGNTSIVETQLYGSVVAGTRVALGTSAVDGFIYIPTCAGTPTGVPTSKTGVAPVVVDTTNDIYYFYSGGMWRTPGGGIGTVTSVSVTTANGVSGVVATATTTPAITLTLGAITPSSVTTGAVVATSLTLGYVAKTANYTLGAADYTVNCTANSFNITLPTAVGITGQIYNIKNTGTGTITVLTTGGQTIDGQASGFWQLSQWSNMQVQSDGANWIIL